MLGKEVQPSGTGDLVVHPLGGILYLAGSDGQIRVLDYEMTVLQVSQSILLESCHKSTYFYSSHPRLSIHQLHIFFP